MTPDAIVLLQKSIGKVIRLTRPDGEVIVAKITLVDPVDEEIVFDMLSSTDESKYEKFDREPAYLLFFSDISAVNEMPDSTCWITVLRRPLEEWLALNPISLIDPRGGPSCLFQRVKFWRFNA